MLIPLLHRLGKLKLVQIGKSGWITGTRFWGSGEGMVVMLYQRVLLMGV